MTQDRTRDWFHELYQRRHAPSQVSSSSSSSSSSHNNSNENESDSESDEISSSDEDEQQSGAESNSQLNRDRIEQNAKKAQVLNTMREKVRDSIRKENDLMQKIPRVKIKQTYRGHRNARTIVMFLILFSN